MKDLTNRIELVSTVEDSVRDIERMIRAEEVRLESHEWSCVWLLQYMDSSVKVYTASDNERVEYYDYSEEGFKRLWNEVEALGVWELRDCIVECEDGTSYYFSIYSNGRNHQVEGYGIDLVVREDARHFYKIISAVYDRVHSPPGPDADN